QIEAQIFSSWSEEKIQEFDSKLQLIVNNLVTDEV
ncbi:MAG: MarR family transcriptional regulator, partial [Lactobacillus johnsonii]|nr:MarR family transcriptional regulator [Lactobacillus johnsonii]